MSKSDQSVKISKAKGRPMLQWVGKKPLTSVKAYPAQHIESFSVEAPKDALADCDWSDWLGKFQKGGLLFHGDNKDVLAYMLANGFRGKIKLIYIDPPFDSAADYVRKVELRGLKNSVEKLGGEEYTLGEQVQYADIWANDNYLQFMYERIILLRELLTEDGAIYLHCDQRRVHFLRCIMDEVFGEGSFRNHCVWVFEGRELSKTEFNSKHNDILFYSKSPEKWTFNWNDPYVRETLKESSIKAMSRYQDESGKWFILRYKDGGGFAPLEEEGPSTYRQYVPEGIPPRDWFFCDYPRKTEQTGYPTQKPISLIRKFVSASTDKNDIVLDCFVGSGTTLDVAQRLGRRWIGCDINKGAIQTTAKRLQTLMEEQVKATVDVKQGELIDDEIALPKPCQISFSTWRVNDYDLQIQHNEAVDLVCEYLGVTRTRTDSHFDGTLGKDLVKIIPFNHPLTPLDLENLREELKRRPDEERNIRLVCLGMELAAKKVIEDYNRSRPINRLHVIELRTDKQYGGIIKHEPLSASVSIKAKGDKVVVIGVKDVFSPTILQRLDMQEGVFRTKIEDWRAVVDCIMIDTDYDGEVFNVKLSDIPARKQDLVNGHYELPLTRKGATVAVKVIDMLGEETLVTAVV